MVNSKTDIIQSTLQTVTRSSMNNEHYYAEYREVTTELKFSKLQLLEICQRLRVLLNENGKDYNFNTFSSKKQKVAQDSGSPA